MGTNDGSRNFSANCDLKRSMSSDRCWPQGGEPREQSDSSSNNRRGQLAHGQAHPTAPLLWHSPCSCTYPLEGTKGGNFPPLSGPPGAGETVRKMAVTPTARAGARRRAAVRGAAGTRSQHRGQQPPPVRTQPPPSREN